MATIPVAGDGVALLYSAIILLALTWFTFLLRILVRMHRKTWGADDNLMMAGLIFFTVTAALCIVCSSYGSGQFAADIPPLTKAKGIKLFYIAEYFYAISATFIKCSIAVTLLRIAAAHHSIQICLWAVISLTCIGAVVFCAGIANICHPIGTLWGEADGTCNLKLNSDVSMFFSAIEIVTDWSLALLPAVLLWNVQMKFSVKISVAVILALGSFASCATIVRLRYLTAYDDPVEFLYGTGKIGFWSLMEEGIGLIAGSMPALRPLLSLRISMSSSATPGPASAGNEFPPSRTPKVDHDRILMQDTVVCAEEGECDFADAESQRNIVKETRYTITSAPAGWDAGAVHTPAPGDGAWRGGV